jgi:predicted transposase/invertase (TIGR01784 family)
MDKTELKYRFTHDTLFKMLFTDYPDLLQKLVAVVLNISFESIKNFVITNPELLPENLNSKFCRLDINMTVNEQKVDLEIQVNNENDFPERSLYYWAREYSSSLGEGEDYANLPRVIIISIIAFKLFDCAEYHSEFQALEVTRHTPLTDKQSLHYFELPKLPKDINQLKGVELWLALFNAKTEEDLSKIEALEVPEMTQAINAYRAITAADKFREAERLRLLALSNEAAALRHARDMERAKWQGVVAEKETAIAEKDVAIAEKDAAIAEQAAAIAEKDAAIAKLLARLGESN